MHAWLLNNTCECPEIGYMLCKLVGLQVCKDSMLWLQPLYIIIATELLLCGYSYNFSHTCSSIDE